MAYEFKRNLPHSVESADNGGCTQHMLKDTESERGGVFAAASFILVRPPPAYL